MALKFRFSSSKKALYLLTPSDSNKLIINQLNQGYAAQGNPTHGQYLIH
ncbi:hypothetical protein VA249_39450 [Vibrio alfacsensis]|nr:hypothetical protein [Vibrio alfacsensis]BBM67299.1 hypothetical protein VA249_39450 [Vibrio alfacsensis]